jgi:hypothetical protein
LQLARSYIIVPQSKEVVCGTFGYRNIEQYYEKFLRISSGFSKQIIQIKVLVQFLSNREYKCEIKKMAFFRMVNGRHTNLNVRDEQFKGMSNLK